MEGLRVWPDLGLRPAASSPSGALRLGAASASASRHRSLAVRSQPPPMLRLQCHSAQGPGGPLAGGPGVGGGLAALLKRGTSRPAALPTSWSPVIEALLPSSRPLLSRAGVGLLSGLVGEASCLGLPGRALAGGAGWSTRLIGDQGGWGLLEIRADQADVA